MMLRFTPEAMGTMLHDVAHEVSPQRLWQAFLGTQHTLVTSWLRFHVYQVDFCGLWATAMICAHGYAQDEWLSSCDGFGGG